MSNHYEVPNWAGKAPTGLHLDVIKEDKLVQKLMIDEKKCYLFGRNPQMNDFCIDHASCSRVHAAFVYHKHLHIAYLVDLGSTHGTFIGTLRIDGHKPTQLQINTTFHFGASTRQYILRERPTASSYSANIMEDIPMSENTDGTLLGLPESQTDLDNLTEYNTAHNRRISLLGISDSDNFKKNIKSKRKRRGVTFNEEEIVINPEDVDPSIGRFRNLIQTTVIPSKKMRIENSVGISTDSPSSSAVESSKNLHQSALIMPHLYQGLPPTAQTCSHDGDVAIKGSKLGLLLPNPAPEVLPSVDNIQTTPSKPFNPNVSTGSQGEEMSEDGPKKKKYAKEAWPGRKPLLGGF